MGKIYVVNKKNGMVIKSFMDEEKARAFASKCNKPYKTIVFVVCVYKAGLMEEI